MRSQARRCPVGCGPLTALMFRGVRLDRCGVCAGVWFDAGEYESLSDLPEAALRTLEMIVAPSDGVHPHSRSCSAKSGKRICPACSATLRTMRPSSHSEAVLDHCDRCFGYWADDADLVVLSELLEADKPYFAPVIAESARREMADAFAEVLTPHHEIRLTLFQSLCQILTRPIGNPTA